MNLDMPPQSDPELVRLRDVLALAKDEVIRGNSPHALGLLRSERQNFEKYRGHSIWGESKLRVAEVLAGQAPKDDDSVMTFFEEALVAVRDLIEPDIDLQIRAHESFGNYLVANLRTRSRAREYFDLAKAAAVQAGLRERSAHIQLKIIRIDLEADESAELANFDMMKRVARQGGYAWDEQLAAWHQHLGIATQTGQGRKAARGENRASEAYFRNLLDSVRIACDEKATQ